eukprot:c46252_g1_i1.p1 GENE.c46252_g1_i1~~c46252_g1_i1.p1  ORF type:complete len:748 (+),score=86.21 c46252_g1_i1:178-2244(+)
MSPTSYWTDKTGWPPVCSYMAPSGREDNLYVFGSNEFGQCGIPLDPLHEQLHSPQRLAALNGNSVLELGLGYQHSLALTYSYSVYAWGKNDKEQLGLGGDTDQNSPARINELTGKRIRKIVAGGFHSGAVDSFGNLYTWGSNNHGQLGRPESRPDFALPVPNLRYREVVSVSFGLLHSCVASREGDAYCWGGGFAYQLGHGTQTDELEPRVITGLQGIPIRTIASGCEHTLALATNGSLYVWGANKYGELGTGDLTPRKTPFWVEMFNALEVNEIQAGCHHSAAITPSGLLYMWGWNAMGQLGSGDTADKHTATLVDTDNFAGGKIAHVALGYAHTVAMTKNRKVFTFGYGEKGQLGLGDDHNRTTAFHIYSLDGSAFEVYAGGYHTGILAEELVEGHNPDPDYNPVNDPKSNPTVKLKFSEDEEADVQAKLNGPYKETIRVHVTPNPNDKIAEIPPNGIAFESDEPQEEDLESAENQDMETLVQTHAQQAVEPQDADDGRVSENEATISSVPTQSSESGVLKRQLPPKTLAATDSVGIAPDRPVEVVPDETGLRAKVEVQAPSPSASPRPLLPVDLTRSSIPMRKERIPTRDPLLVKFRDPHTTMEKFSAYHQKEEFTNATLSEPGRSHMQSTSYHHRLTHSALVPVREIPTSSLIPDDDAPIYSRAEQPPELPSDKTSAIDDDALF